MASTVIWQRVEGALVFAAAILIYATGDPSFSLWLSLLLFFAPDLSFLGYLAGPRVGAVAYNGVHIYGTGALLIAVGLLLGIPVLAGLGLLWLAHCGFDRMMGYGLKLLDGFGHTHLGRIGRVQ